MTIRQNFLLLFADYREALERAQRAEDQAQRERYAFDEMQKRYDDLVQRSLAREKEMTEQVMRVRFGDRIVLTPEQIAAKIAEVRPRAEKDQSSDSLRGWQQKQTEAALAALNG